MEQQGRATGQYVSQSSTGVKCIEGHLGSVPQAEARILLNEGHSMVNCTLKSVLFEQNKIG